MSFRILPNGGLTRLNSAGIKGMRGCHLATDAEDKYIFVSGYHDGKETILRLNPDGTVGEITDKVFHKGLGSVAERNFRPHVSCAGRTPDGEFLMAADLGIDQVKIYGFDSEKGTISGRRSALRAGVCAETVCVQQRRTVFLSDVSAEKRH